MKGQPCPRCGGDNRFFFIANPRNEAHPFWMCRQCRYTESESQTITQQTQRKLDENEIILAQHGYTAVANWCHSYLMNNAKSHPIREYLLQRGFTMETLSYHRIGYHPGANGSADGADSIWATDREGYEGARIGGLLGPLGRPKSVLRECITIPYWHNEKCTLIRGRSFDGTGAKYRSPSGVELYAGGSPTLYLSNTLDDSTQTIILTEGEFKALAVWQIREELGKNITGVAQPGIGYFPASFIDQLKSKTVIICYDTEQRKDPFVLSPGEKFTIQACERLTGIWLENQIAMFEKRIAMIEKQKGDADDGLAHMTRLETLMQQLVHLQSLHIRIKVVRLPRQPDEKKVDLDSFIQTHGSESLKQLISQAQDGHQWHDAHSGQEYSYLKGGIYNGKFIANYQARIVESISKNDGQEIETFQRIAIQSPSGRRHTIDISMDEWSDDSQARKAVRKAICEGTFDDNSREILRAIRILSAQGDNPAERKVYAATGWEKIDNKWHLLVSDGAINATGITTSYRAEIDPPDAVGNLYHMCGKGDATTGAKAWISFFLSGLVCPRPLALILSAHATLPLLHRFMGNAARSMAWVYNETGSMKTSVIRAGIMALYGPKYTAERADGAPVPKWDATSVGLGYLSFLYRDMPLLIDDYKMGMINPNFFKTFLHNYSEGSGRTRGKLRKLDRLYPARSINFSTAEDIPCGDPGMMARLMPMQLKPERVNTDALTELQRAGVEGHLAAFWREFIKELAISLDKHGEEGINTKITDGIRADDALLPGHKRTQGSLRQNRAAFLVLTNWLRYAGYISQEEHDELNHDHLEARTILSSVLEERQKESRASTIFLNVLHELINNGQYIIEEENMACPRCGTTMDRTNDGWFCNNGELRNGAACTYHLPMNRVIGFRTDIGIGIAPQMAFREISRIRNDQKQPFQYSSNAIWAQLDSDGLLAKKGKGGIYTINYRNTACRSEDGRGKGQRCLLLTFSALEECDLDTFSESDTKKTLTRLTGENLSDGNSDEAISNRTLTEKQPIETQKNGTKKERLETLSNTDQISSQKHPTPDTPEDLLKHYYVIFRVVGQWHVAKHSIKLYTCDSFNDAVEWARHHKRNI